MTNPEFRSRAGRCTASRSTPRPARSPSWRRTPGRSAPAHEQIETNIDTYEAAWRAEHPGEEPGPALRQAWDRRAWADARPDKVVPTTGEELRHRWVEELHELGYVAPAPGAPLPVLRTGDVDRDGVVELALVRLGSRRSAWNAADARGEVERLIASGGGVVDRRRAPRAGRGSDRSRHRRVTAAPPPIGRARARAFVHVGRRAGGRARDRRPARDSCRSQDDHRGRGRGRGWQDRPSRGTRERAIAAGRRMVVVTPTRKAAQVAAGAIGASSYSAAWLLHQHGFRWDEDGRWSRVDSVPDVSARLRRGDLLVVDEAGMLDQDTARALLGWPTRPAHG